MDAITARRKLGYKFDERVTVELYPSRTITVHDNGIGLTERDIHQFLSQIGHTSKREDKDAADDFIGQFGVGLLACFVVSEEIVLTTRSALEGDTLEWRGRPDGTYTIRKLEKQGAIGTTVYLTCKEEHEEYFDFYRIRELLEHYGSYLPTKIQFIDMEDSYECRINETIPPWRMDRAAALEYGREHLHESFLDAIQLKSMIGEVEGVAYVRARPVSLQAEKSHKVYLKNMLVSDKY